MEVLKRALSRPLESDDLFRIPSKLQARHLSEQVGFAWQELLSKVPAMSSWQSCLVIFGPGYFLLALLQLALCTLSYAGPVILSQLLAFLASYRVGMSFTQAYILGRLSDIYCCSGC